MNNLLQLSEDIEREALISLYTHCPALIREQLGFRMLEVADALVSVSAGLPGILTNRTLGLGSRRNLQPESLQEKTEQTGVLPGDTLESIVEIYRSNPEHRYFIHLYEEMISDSDYRLLKALHLEPARAWMKFHRDCAPATEVPTNLVIKEIGPEQVPDFARIVCAGFEIPSQGEALVCGLVRDPRWHLFLSYNENQPAGAGGLFVQGQSGWLDWAATAPEFRRRGSQTAIMAARINRARELGCEHLFTETGAEVPGDPQHSYRNILKAGFSELHLRQNFAPAQKT